MTPAARATRIVRSVPVIASRVQDVGEEAPELGEAGRELEPPVAELDDRDRGEVGAFAGRIGLDVALDESWSREIALRLVRRGGRSAGRGSHRTGRSPGVNRGRGRGGE